MPSGIYTRTKFHREISSQSIKKRYKNGEKIGFQIGHKRVRTLESYQNLKYRKKMSKISCKYSINNNFFSVYTPESCYWAGFIAADGNIYKNVLTIAISQKDQFHIKNFLNTIQSNHPIYEDSCKRFGGKLSKIQIGNIKIKNDILDNFNIVERKSLILQYPIKMPRKFDKYFIRGYFDGDGSLAHKRKINGQLKNELRFILASGSLFFLQTIQNILIQKCRLRKTKIMKRKNGHCYVLEYSGNLQVLRIMNFLNIPFALKRKSIK